MPPTHRPAIPRLERWERDLRAWLHMPVWLNRGRVLAVAWLLGLLLGFMTYVFVSGLATARDQREGLKAQQDANTATIQRLAKLEHLSPRDARARVDVFLDNISDAQAERALRLAVKALTPKERRQLLSPPRR